MNFAITGILIMMSLSHSALNIYQGKNRILLVFYPSSVDPLYKTQLNEIRKHEEDLKERDLIVIEVGPSDTRNLRQDFQVSSEHFTAILGGKDGGEKLRTQHVILVGDLNATIDKMPMRREELKKRPGFHQG